MSEKEKKMLTSIGKSLKEMDDEQKNYLLGYSEGVASTNRKIRKEMKEYANIKRDPRTYGKTSP